jgi:Domain of unknown function (DUF1814).
MDDEGATLLKNTYEQSFIEKLRSLLKFGANSRRYKDIFDMYYLRIVVSENKMKELMDILIFSDSFFAELEKSSAEQKKRIEQAREDKKTQKKEDENEANES